MEALSLALALGLQAQAQNPENAGGPSTSMPEAVVSGRVVVRGQREPVVGSRISVVPVDDEDGDQVPADPGWVRQARSGTDGTFEVEVPPQPCLLVVLAPGYERQTVAHDCGTEKSVTIYMRPTPGEGFRTVVHSPRSPERFRVSERLLDPVEIATLPGTQGDPLRAIQNLPGVARAPGGLGVIVLRGAAPSESAVFFGDHPIPRAFHALGFSSVVPADVIHRVEVVPGNASSRYGNTVGGLTRLVPRLGNTSSVHGYGEIDLASAGAMVEGPVGDGSFILNAQRGWVDGVLQAVEAIDRNATFMLPRYYDYHAALDVPVDATASVGLRVLGAGDRVISRIQASPDPRRNERLKNFELSTSFHRFDVSFRRKLGRTRFLLTPAVRLDRRSWELRGIPNAPARKGTVVTLRAELEHVISDRARFRLGTDLLVDRFTAPSLWVSDTAVSVRPRTGHTHLSSGAYADLELGTPRFAVWPGARLSGFAFGKDTRAAVDPRLSMRWKPGPRWDLRAGVGSYSSGHPIYTAESAGVLDGSSQVLPGNAIFPPALADAVEQAVPLSPVGSVGLAFVQALQTSVSVSRAFGALWRVEIGAFGRWREGPLSSGALGQATFLRQFDVNAHQRDVGMEVWIRRRLGHRLYGWLAYTLMQSEVSTVKRPSDYDQRHNLVLVASYELPRQFRIGGRFRLVSGSPYTPVVGSVSISGVFTDLEFRPIAGEANSARFPLYHQLDLRVDKRWILRRTILSAYVDVQNVYNRQNVEAWFYDRTYDEPVAGLGLPIFPSLGFRIDY